MAWTYDLTTTPLTDLARVRMRLGDTDASDQQLSDEEIFDLLGQTGSVTGAVARAASVLAFRYARQADKWVGDLKILASQKSRAYRELAESLGTVGSVYFGVPSAGGVYQGDKEEAEADSSLATPYFRRGQHDNS